MQLLDAAQMGWWKADFRTGELFFSDYIVDLLGLGSNRAAGNRIRGNVARNYRTRSNYRAVADPDGIPARANCSSPTTSSICWDSAATGPQSGN